MFDENLIECHKLIRTQYTTQSNLQKKKTTTKETKQLLFKNDGHDPHDQHDDGHAPRWHLPEHAHYDFNGYKWL
jgi:hypothetical protein